MPVDGVYTRCANADSRSEPAAGPVSRTNFEAPAQEPPASSPSRFAISGPLVRADPYPKLSRRAIGGTSPPGVGEARPPPDTDPRTVVFHAAPGDAGVSVIPSPGVLKSIGIKPVATVTRSHQINSGNSSGAPLPEGSLMSMSPIRNDVCDHDPRKPPTRVFSPTFKPLPLK